MTWRGKDATRRRILTPIGDELHRRGQPLEPGEPSALDTVRRIMRRPVNPVGSVAYGTCVFALAVGVLAALSYGLGLLLERH